MKAVRIHSYGGHEVLSYEDSPRPTPADGEVLIRVQATSVNPFDVAVRAGYMAGYFHYTLPLIPGTDVAGVIEAVGAGANGFKPGDPVYARAGVYRDGAYAEYVAVSTADVAAKPQSLDFIHSAAIPHAALTAWQALFVHADLQAGQTVLIHAASGGVGHIAVQLAKWRGAKVIGTTSKNINFLEELKVDQIVNYATTPFETVAKNVDVVLDAIGGETQERSWAALKPGGILVSIVQNPSPEKAAAHGVRQAMVMTAPPIGQTLKEVAALVDAGTIKPHVSAVIPLSEIRKAHGMIESGHTRGKIVIQVK
jgi:NADPH:quinone reductase-like Zn-dependent oxidoreductase